MTANAQDAVNERIEIIFGEQLSSVHRRRDRVFAWLMAGQLLAALLIAWIYSPYTWTGKIHSTQSHVFAAIFVGGCLSIPTILLTVFRPGWIVTRYTVAIAQMLWSALLIHLTGGRIETHFHVFGSLALLAFYRDWKLLITATVVVAGDHLVRGIWWPESVYGITNPEWWRILEHASWIIFAVVVLAMGIRETLREMRVLAERQAAMEQMNTTIEQKVVERTCELEASREQYRSLVETTKAVPWQWDRRRGRFTYVGPQAARLLGCQQSEWLTPGFWEDRLHPADRAAVRELWMDQRGSPDGVELEFRLRRDDGVWVWARSIVSGGERSDGSQLQGLMFDITQKRQTELELHQAQNLESAARLGARVANEINAPMQFVSDRVHFVREGIQDLLLVIDKLHAVQTSVIEGRTSDDAIAAAVEAERVVDLTRLTENVREALDRSLDGLSRVSSTVRSMKDLVPQDREAPAAHERATAPVEPEVPVR